MKRSLWWLCNAVCAIGLAACNSASQPAEGGPSCASLAMTCGASGKDSCCASPQVAGGTYDRSYDVAGDGNSGNTNFPATVSGFRLDKYEVTVGRFRAFVQASMGTQANPPQAGAGTHASIAGSGWDPSWNTKLAANMQELAAAVQCNAMFQTWTDQPGANEDRPMNCLTWFEAMAFCAWDGGYLPTETEWNYVATGGDQQRAYPWSTPSAPLTLDNTRASYFDGTNCMGDGMPGCAVTDLIPVGTKPEGDGRWGQSDLAGNVAEWTLDWLSGYSKPCADCANLTAASGRVTRGGSVVQDAFLTRTTARGSLAPANRSHAMGARCARPL